MAEINLSKYGINGTTEIIHNPSYEFLFEEETKSGLTGYEKRSGKRTWRSQCNDRYLHRTFAERQVYRNG